jgi:stearoyl-CoA desaturase (delta-9 desaturase)
MTYCFLVGLSWLGVVREMKRPPEPILRNEQFLGSRVVRRAAEQLAGRFSPECIALDVKASVHATGMPVREVLSLLQGRIDLCLPHMPTRDGLLVEARQLFARTRSLDDIVDRAHELLVETVGSLLVLPHCSEDGQVPQRIGTILAARSP